MSDRRRLLVIGGGIGGYTAAIRGARNGLDVTLVEKERLGGVCLNLGCIPTKSLLHESRSSGASPSSADGVGAASPGLDLIRARKDKAVAHLVAGVEALIRRNGIAHVAGTAAFIGPRRIRIAETGAEIDADHVVIATGSAPIRPTIDGIDLPGVMVSDDAVAMTHVPGRVTIIGGGVIGVEFAQIYANLGVQVTLLELAPRLLGDEDPEAVAVLAEALSRQGVDIRLGCRVEQILAAGQDLKILARCEDGTPLETIGDAVLVAVGRRPALAALDLDRVGIVCAAGSIVVDEWRRTSVAGVYAVGDVCGAPLLAHKAAADAETALADMLGHGGPSMLDRAIPRAVYTSPELASVGLSEDQARLRGPVTVGRFPFSANGRAIAGGHPEGFVKIVADSRHEQILGVTMVGHGVTELLGEASLAVQMEFTLAALAETVHAHPTLSEALVEAALDARGNSAIHLPPKRARATASSGSMTSHE